MLAGLERFRSGTLLSHASRFPGPRKTFYQAIGTDQPTRGSEKGRGAMPPAPSAGQGTTVSFTVAEYTLPAGFDTVTW
jgi:hypothetical protein